MMKRKIFICECNSLEHQVIFWYDKDDDIFYCEPHLVTHKNFFKRIWIALKYIVGYKSKYGHWDETIFKEKDLEKLYKYLKKNYNKSIPISKKTIRKILELTTHEQSEGGDVWGNDTVLGTMEQLTDDVIKIIEDAKI